MAVVNSSYATPPYEAGLKQTAKESSVQDRLAHTLNALMRSHDLLDACEGNPVPDGPGQPPLGILQGALSCEEQAARLAERLAELRERLGSL